MSTIMYEVEYGRRTGRTATVSTAVKETLVGRYSDYGEGKLEALDRQIDNLQEAVAHLVEVLHASGRVSDDDLRHLTDCDYEIEDES